MSNDLTLYTTQLGAGLGLVEETQLLLSLYEPGTSSSELHQKALSSGLFPLVSARRLRNIVAECFAPRYVKPGSAVWLKPLVGIAPTAVMVQLFLFYTCAANRILADFIREVYWERYSSGRDTLSVEDARDFVTHAVREGRTQTDWSESIVKRVSSYLLGCCADYGMLASSRGSLRAIQPIRVHELTLLYIVHWLHFHDTGDNALLNHECWALFGLDAFDVKEELKRLARRGWLIIQSAGDVTRITWQLGSMEEVVHVVAEG